MTHFTRHSTRIAAVAAMAAMLTACNPPPKPNIITAPDPDEFGGGCPDGYSWQGGIYPNDPGLNLCVQQAPDGWVWITDVQGEGSDATMTITGACTTSAPLTCVTY